MLMRSLYLECMIWLFAKKQKEMWLLASEWLATPGIRYYCLINDKSPYFNGFFERSLCYDVTLNMVDDCYFILQLVLYFYSSLTPSYLF